MLRWPRKYLVYIGLALAGVFALSVYSAGSFLTSPYRTKVALPDSLGGEAVRFKSESGSLLHGTWIVGMPGRPVVILMHGVRADRRSMVRRASFFKKRGYGVLLFDFQAHGESPGDLITFGYLETRDAQAAFKFAQVQAPWARIGVVGCSLGGAAAVLGDSPVAADALILESVYPDIRTATDNRIKRFLGPVSKILTPLFIWQVGSRLNANEADMRPVEHMAQVHQPVLILSGSADLHTTVADTRAMFAAANEPKRLEFFEGAKHVDLYDFDPLKYEGLVGGFFARYLESGAMK